MFNIFDASNDEFFEIVRSKIKDYYNYEIKKGYVDGECDLECYLFNIDSLPILDNYLFVYKIISLNSRFFYATSSEFDLFHFGIKKM